MVNGSRTSGSKKPCCCISRTHDNNVIDSGDLRYFDKVPTKFSDYSEQDFRSGGFRVVPSAIARKGTFIGRNVVLMPSYVNIGAYVDEGTMNGLVLPGDIALRADRQERASFGGRRHRRRARTAAGQSDHH